MEKYVRVPVVDVHKDNIKEVWPSLFEEIGGADFIALDTELSGLGDRKKLMAKSIEDRYKNLIEVATSRAILTVGISCFKDVSSTIALGIHTDTPKNSSNHGDDTSSDHNGVCFTVKTFNLSVLCSQEFVVEPGSLQFLIQHGFDFNKQFSKGIPYYGGTDKEPHEFTSLTMRNIFSHILLSNKPVVVHNGMLDLAFLYQNLYNNLPGKLEVFTADLFEMFSAGVLDTKYVAEFQLREPASYLGYIFRKCQRKNSSLQDSSQKHVSIEFTDVGLPAAWVEYLCCNAKPTESDDGNIQVCEIYAAHGYCHQGVECHLSHDLDHILDIRDKKQSSKRKRKNRKRKLSSTGEDMDCSRKKEDLLEGKSNINSTVTQNVNNTVSTINTFDNSSGNQRKNDLEMDQESAIKSGPKSPISTCNIDSNSTKNALAVSGGHRAGIDAFMTGYCLATYLVQCGGKGLANTGWVNKISLSGKELPLTLAQSHFSKPSSSHTQKMKLLKQNMSVNSINN